MHTNAPTIPPPISPDAMLPGDLLATGGIRAQPRVVEHVSEHTSLANKDGLWTTSPVGGWLQLDRAMNESGARILLGGEYGAGWSAWLGIANMPQKLEGPDGQVGFVVGMTRRDTRYWNETLDLDSRGPVGGDSIGPIQYVRYTDPHFWMRMSFALQARDWGPWVELSYVPLYSWGGQSLDGYFSMMGSLAAGWHHSVGADDRVIGGWRASATGYSVSHQGMFLWQHAFRIGSPRPFR